MTKKSLPRIKFQSRAFLIEKDPGLLLGPMIDVKEKEQYHNAIQEKNPL